MPRVPSFNTQTVESRGLPNARLSEQTVNVAGAFQGVANAARGLGQVFAQEAQEERDRADTAAVLEAETALDNFENETLFNPESGAFTRKGKDAFDLPNQVLPGYDDQVRKIEQGLGSDRAKLSFKQRAVRRRGGIGQQLNRYEAQQREGYYEQQDKATIESSRLMATRYFNHPSKIDEQLQRQRFAIESTAKRNGLSTEQTQ